MKNIFSYNQETPEQYFQNFLNNNVKLKNLINTYNLESDRKKYFDDYDKLFSLNCLEQLLPSPLTYDKSKTGIAANAYYGLYSSSRTYDLFDYLTTDVTNNRDAAKCPSCLINDAQALDHC